jgi:hypothetical protein
MGVGGLQLTQPPDAAMGFHADGRLHREGGEL